MEQLGLQEKQMDMTEKSDSDIESINLGEVYVEEGKKRHHSHHSHQKADHNSRHGVHHRRRRRKKLTLKQIFIRVVFVILVLMILAAAGILHMFQSGEKSLKKENLTEIVEESELIVEESGVQYVMKDSIINILLIGVDSKGKDEKVSIQGSGNGQSDVLLLLSLDTEANNITVIPINRDTMTSITIKDQAGNERGQEEAQIALSYSYGINNEESTLLTAQAVSNLMHGLKIHGYCTVNISAIPIVNDAVGGVEVTLPEDFVKEWGATYVKGNTVLLRGSMAEDYIRARLNRQDPTNVARMERQRAYLISLAQKVISQSRSDPKLAVSIYRKLTPYMTTNIKLNEFSYLVSEALKCEFTDASIRTIQGKEDDSKKYMEFRVDEEQLESLIREIYYQEVTQ